MIRRGRFSRHSPWCLRQRFGDGTAASGSWPTEPPAAVGHTYATPFFGPGFTTVTLTLTDAAGQRDSDTINLIGIDGSPD